MSPMIMQVLGLEGRESGVGAGAKMKLSRLRLLLFSFHFVTFFSGFESAPIKIAIERCTVGVFDGGPYYCCPPEPKRPIIDFKLVHDPSKRLRTRRALQCLDDDELEAYVAKLEKAYMLMRGLPDDDPRSLLQQKRMHCAYGSGSFSTGGKGVDIHFNWLFQPWHRLFLYFHERILQGLLGDPTFSIHFWNWDNDGALGLRDKRCSKPGNIFPPIYANPPSPLFNPRRTVRAETRSLMVDLTVNIENMLDIPSLPDSVKLALNGDLMHSVMVMNSTNSDIFLGPNYRSGEEQPVPSNGGGSLELSGHTAIHFWVGLDLADVPTAAGDPVFYAHHGNVDRLWNLWHSLGPGRTDPEDPDWLDAEFQFYDENADLVRIRIRDGLDLRVLGYQYEEVDDISWNFGKEGFPIHESSVS